MKVTNLKSYHFLGYSHNSTPTIRSVTSAVVHTVTLDSLCVPRCSLPVTRLRRAGWFGPCPGQRTGGSHRARCSLDSDSVTNHTFGVCEGVITQSGAKVPGPTQTSTHHTERNTTRNVPCEQFGVMLGMVPPTSFNFYRFPCPLQWSLPG